MTRHQKPYEIQTRGPGRVPGLAKAKSGSERQAELTVRNRQQIKRTALVAKVGTQSRGVLDPEGELVLNRSPKVDRYPYRQFSMDAIKIRQRAFKRVRVTHPRQSELEYLGNGAPQMDNYKSSPGGIKVHPGLSRSLARLFILLFTSHPTQQCMSR